MKYESHGGTNCNCCPMNNPLRLSKGTGRVENQRTNKDHPDIVEVSQNIKKSAESLKRLAVTLTPVKKTIS